MTWNFEPPNNNKNNWKDFVIISLITMAIALLAIGVGLIL